MASETSLAAEGRGHGEEGGKEDQGRQDAKEKTSAGNVCDSSYAGASSGRSSGANTDYTCHSTAGCGRDAAQIDYYQRH
jgi:hypothetical protein